LDAESNSAERASIAGRPEKGKTMKYAGLLVMPAGFFLAIAALVLFPASPSRAAFVLCGLAVEALGLVVAVRGHMQARGESRP
jgi:hypothetical protein